MVSKNEVDKIHEYNETLHENYFVPAHPPRTESEGYKKLRKKLIVDEDMPCEVCGLRNSQVIKGSKINIELHHNVVEWAWHTVADQKKVAKKFSQVENMTRQEFLDWLDHSVDIARILCTIHHRHSELGIHETSAPAFNLVEYLQDDFKLVDNENV